jgi:hypothetical protein
MVLLNQLQSDCYKTWMPKLFKSAREALDKVLALTPSLKPVYAASAFSLMTINFRPSTTSNVLIDNFQTVSGDSAITAAGHYDYRKGGHLVLREWKTVIEFPPCSTILIPSTVAALGTVGIAPSEQRILLAQYSTTLLQNLSGRALHVPDVPREYSQMSDLVR